MKIMNYQQAYSKIIDAYFRDEIQPMSPKFCFCGNLCDNTTNWHTVKIGTHNDSHGYTGKQLYTMERALFKSMEESIGQIWFIKDRYNTPGYEDALFAGMSAALEVLKQIHRERGENVDEEVREFVKREFVNKVNR